MNFIKKLKNSLPDNINFEELYSLASAGLWKSDPKEAAILAIKRSDFFDSERYAQEYEDINNIKIDPIDHYVRYGIEEHRNFFLKNI